MGGLQSTLPDPAMPNMLFIPSNSAFYHILTGGIGACHSSSLRDCFYRCSDMQNSA